MVSEKIISSEQVVKPAQPVQKVSIRTGRGQGYINLSTPQTTVITNIGQLGQVGQHNRIKNNTHNAMVKSRIQLTSCAMWLRLGYSSPQTLGKYGEQFAFAWLKSSGYVVADVSQDSGNGDLRVTIPDTGEIVRVEVKTATRGNDNRFQFCLKNRFADIQESDYVLFLIVDRHSTLYHYVVPTAILGKTSKLSLRTHPTRYRGKIAPFLIRSESIDLSDIQTTYQLLEHKP